MIKIILIIVAVFIVYCLIEMIRELRDFRRDEVSDLLTEIKWNQKGQKRLYSLSDLHNRMYGEENERLLKSIRKSASGSDSDRR